MADISNYELGKVAYDAYCEKRGWKSVNGAALPKWEMQDDMLKEAWAMGAQAVRSRLFNLSPPNQPFTKGESDPGGMVALTSLIEFSLHCDQLNDLQFVQACDSAMESFKTMRDEKLAEMAGGN